MSDVLAARVPKSEIPGVYERVAPVYDLWAMLTESRARHRCRHLANVRDGEAVLEVAVGTGLLLKDLALSNPSGTNVGIDLTEAMLVRARTRLNKAGLTNFSLSLGDAYMLDFPDETFDVLVNNYMFDLLPERDFETVLTEFRRVLRPGGRLCLANMTKPDRQFRSFWERLYRINPRLMGGCRGVLMMPYVRSLGFVSCRRETVSQFGFPSELIFGQKPFESKE